MCVLFQITLWATYYQQNISYYFLWAGFVRKGFYLFLFAWECFLVGLKILDDEFCFLGFFSSQHFECHPIASCSIISDGKSSINLSVVIFVTSYFYTSDFYIFTLAFQHFHHVLSGWRSLYTILVRVGWTSCMCRLQYFFKSVLRTFQPLLLQIFFYSYFPLSLCMYLFFSVFFILQNV